MNLIRLMSLVLLGTLTLSAYAAKDIDLAGASANLGNLGDIRDTAAIANNGVFTLTRSDKTAKKVELLLQVQEPQMICARYVTQNYPCNCTYYPAPRPPHGGGYPYPYPYPYPGPIPGGPGYCYTCTRTTCAEYKVELVTDTKNIKLNFKRAEDMDANDAEYYDLKIRSNGSNLSYELQAPGQYKVKQSLGNRFKIKKASLK